MAQQPHIQNIGCAFQQLATATASFPNLSLGNYRQQCQQTLVNRMHIVIVFVFSSLEH